MPDGMAGNLFTVTKMKQMARSRMMELPIREFALSILRGAGITSHNYLEEARAIGAFVQNNVTYRKDPDGVEQLMDPLLMVQDIQSRRAAGDCDDMSLLIATLLLAIGGQPYFRTVRYKGNSGPFNHIYVVVYDGNYNGAKQRLVLDAIFKDQPIGFETPSASGQEFEV